MELTSAKALVRPALAILRDAREEGASTKDAVRLVQAFIAACMIAEAPENPSGKEA